MSRKSPVGRQKPKASVKTTPSGVVAKRASVSGGVKRLSPFARDVARGLQEAIAYVRGEGAARVGTVDVPDPAPEYNARQVAKIRGALGLTQVRFARLMNVSTTSVEGWESGKKSPGPASRRLLQMVSDEKTLAVVARLQGLKIVRPARSAKASAKGSVRGELRGTGKTKTKS